MPFLYVFERSFIQLLCSLIEKNPFESKLNLSLYQSKLAEIAALLATCDDDEERTKLQRLHDYYENARIFTTLVSVVKNGGSHLVVGRPHCATFGQQGRGRRPQLSFLLPRGSRLPRVRH